VETRRTESANKQAKSGRIWLNDGSCNRLKPEYKNHVWSYDFVHHRTDDGRAFRTLNILDEFSRECLAIRVKRKLNSTDVVEALTDLFILRGIPAFIRSDNGPEFIAEIVRNWISAVEAKTAYIEPGSSWAEEDKKTIWGIVFPTMGYCESFNARLRDELLNGEVFYTLKEAQIIIEEWLLSVIVPITCRARGNTTTPRDHTVHWATDHRPQNPSSRWTKGQSCTNIQHGPVNGG